MITVNHVHFKNLPKLVEKENLKKHKPKKNGNRQTIKTEVLANGVGLHTGKEVKMTFKPAPANNGFTFVRVDLEGQPVVEADANHVVNTQRGTNLETVKFKP
jgi:UDP-3-O-[3-hydroxymyristoyl] N-acetylglucosamine deacetylase/3-hydroxyacyl-[acyl-carrier-protein] dehydratase